MTTRDPRGPDRSAATRMRLPPVQIVDQFWLAHPRQNGKSGSPLRSTSLERALEQPAAGEPVVPVAERFDPVRRRQLRLRGARLGQAQVVEAERAGELRLVVPGVERPGPRDVGPFGEARAPTTRRSPGSGGTAGGRARSPAPADASFATVTPSAPTPTTAARARRGSCVPTVDHGSRWLPSAHSFQAFTNTRFSSTDGGRNRSITRPAASARSAPACCP